MSIALVFVRISSENCSIKKGEMFCKLRYGARPLVSLVATAGRKTPGCAQLPVMHRLMSTAEATTFEEWRKTLDEEKQKKFARIQLEVS